MRATYGYIDAKYDNDLADINGDQVVTDNSDLESRNTPANTFGLTTSYTIPARNGDLNGMLSYRWRVRTRCNMSASPWRSIERFGKELTSMIVVLWGVSGCGKSTVGAQLAVALGWTFYDADDFHPAANINKMRQGIALQDADRYPWLAQLRTLLDNTNAQGCNAVLACSALKQDYRERLGIDDQDIYGVHLSGSTALIRARLSERSHEFMRDSLLASQFATLEPSATGLRLDISSSPGALCAEIIQALALTAAP